MLKKLFIVCVLLFSVNLSAEVITDGTLGLQRDLPGHYYDIKASLGQLHGDNLFHSFQEFNLQSGEIATFNGPNNVQNVISRVTGGNPSNIDGLIRSAISNADMYFLNPYGIMFGPNAELDIQGSFHASTAHYLRLGDGGNFNAINPDESNLTVAPVEAFGFLGQSEPIEVRGSYLEAPVGETLSLIGGVFILKMGLYLLKVVELIWLP